MKEFKFRAWWKEKKRMIYFNLADIYHEGCLQGNVEGLNSWLHEDKDIMQYIGKEDKNKNPIYEGDLVQTKWQHCGITNYEYEGLGIIKYNKCAFVIDDSSEVVICPPHSYDKEALLQIEVIGNIYEDLERTKS